MSCRNAPQGTFELAVDQRAGRAPIMGKRTPVDDK